MGIEYFECQQGTDEWKEIRAGLVTCSQLKCVLAKGEGKTRLKYMRQLAGEIITGNPIKSYTNEDMERGQEQEPEARALMVAMGFDVRTTGFFKNTDIGLGVSPDGLIGEDVGAEIKCCLPDIQVERLERYAKTGDGVPSEYRAQVEGSILATGRTEWKFFSYSPGMPPLIVNVTLSDDRRKEIEAELLAFNNELDAMVKRVTAMFNQ